MKKTPGEYIALRNSFKPGNINFIFLYESPQADGAYFYDFKNTRKDLLFKPMMKLIDFKYSFLNEQIKLKGLRKFQELGYFVVDSVYEPVNTIPNDGVRDKIILNNFNELVEDLKSISADTLAIPIILVKTNTFRLLNGKLKKSGFNVVNDSVPVPNLTDNKEDKFLRRINEIFVCQQILANKQLRKYYLPLGIPHEYSVKSSKVKAIVIGADPSNFDSSGNTRVYSHVFDIMGKGATLFGDIKDNLRTVGLDKINIYVQNLVRNYMTLDASVKMMWPHFAELWKPLLKSDLDILDPKRELPVFVTEEYVLDALLNPGEERLKQPIDYYVNGTIIEPDQNILNRSLVPCFTGAYAYTDFPLFVKKVRKRLML